MGMTNQRLELVRLMLVISAFSPVFILWAIRGPAGISEKWLWVAVCLFAVLPNAIIYLRYRIALKRQDRRSLQTKQASDTREHLLIYLFAMLMPLYDANMSCWRDTAALIAAFALVVFIFWHLDLNYLNLLFALMGFRLYVLPADSASHSRGIILFSRRHELPPSAEVSAYRLSDTIYVEAPEKP